VKLQKLAQYCGVIAQRKMSVELNKVIQDSIDVKVPLLTLVQNLWKMKNGLYFLGYYCYYVDSDFELVKLLLGFRNCQGSHDAVNIGVWTLLDLCEGITNDSFQQSIIVQSFLKGDTIVRRSMLEDVKIDKRKKTNRDYIERKRKEEDLVKGTRSLLQGLVYGICADGASNSILARRTMGVNNMFHCLAHVLNLAIKDALKSESYSKFERRVTIDIIKPQAKHKGFVVGEWDLTTDGDDVKNSAGRRTRSDTLDSDDAQSDDELDVNQLVDLAGLTLRSIPPSESNSEISESNDISGDSNASHLRVPINDDEEEEFQLINQVQTVVEEEDLADRLYKASNFFRCWKYGHLYASKRVQKNDEEQVICSQCNQDINDGLVFYCPTCEVEGLYYTCRKCIFINCRLCKGRVPTPLKLTEAPADCPIKCDFCGTAVSTGNPVHSCSRCECDICVRCHDAQDLDEEFINAIVVNQDDTRVRVATTPQTIMIITLLKFTN